MGKRASSSKKKPFSKRKTSKILSGVRRRKRSTRNKSKKLRHRGDSVSSYSDDDSRRSVSVSSSSSEDDYKSRRARSRTRIDRKSGRKRGQRSSSSRESREDSRCIRKSKGSKRNHDSERKKKTQKKRPRRVASISSTSCSTCQGRSSSNGEENEFERSKGRSRENKKDKIDSVRTRSESKYSIKRSSSCSSFSRYSEESEIETSRGRFRENKKDKIDSVRPRSESQYSRERSPSCSSFSRYGDSRGNNIKSKLATENNSKRLRSVISIACQSEEKKENKFCKDEHKEEITYDHDDYPSCRSNESNDEGSKELTHHSHVVSEKRRKVENITGRMPFVSNPATSVYPECGKNGASQHDRNNLPPTGIVSSNPKKENVNEVSAANVGSDGNDLELILRQKALENLKNFRGCLQKNSATLAGQKNKDDSDVKQFSTAKDEFVQIMLPNQSSTTTLRSESSCRTVISRKIPDGKYCGSESGTAKRSVVLPLDGVAASGNSAKEMNTDARSFNDKSEPSGSKLRQESSGTDSTMKQATTPRALSKANLLVTKSIANEKADETSQATAKSGSNNHSTGVKDVSGCAVIEPLSTKLTSEEHSSKEKHDEAKDGSQFEHKTMSVMRGGEMVQVSYKVKIPKRALSLSRRQLRR